MKTIPKIFLVDDDPFSLNSYSEQLKQFGYHDITLVSSGEECIRKLNKMPDIIFLDHNMDDMNGLDVLQRIKHFYPDIKVIIVTGKQDVHAAVNALKCGAHDYILKGEEEVRQMKKILGNLFSVPNGKTMSKSVFRRMVDSISWTCLINAVLILQIGMIIYYFSSKKVSVEPILIILLCSVIAFLLCKKKTVFGTKKQ